MASQTMTMADVTPSLSSSRKRKPEDDLSDEQRFAKRFDLLNIDNAVNGSRLYIPVSPSSHPSTAPANDINGDHMSLDDTKHKVYIYDLDAELASDSDSEAKPIFIPDIERHLNNLPKVMLTDASSRDAAKNMQMILYSVPSSLSVPAEHDPVRKAILESRARARERQGWDNVAEIGGATRERKASLGELEEQQGKKRADTRARRTQSVGSSLGVPMRGLEEFNAKATVNGYSNTGMGIRSHEYDPDAMDMD